jgi:hypothetical protein
MPPSPTPRYVLAKFLVGGGFQGGFRAKYECFQELITQYLPKIGLRSRSLGSEFGVRDQGSKTHCFGDARSIVRREGEIHCKTGNKGTGEQGSKESASWGRWAELWWGGGVDLSYSAGRRGRVRVSAGAGRERGAFLKVASRRWRGYSGCLPSRAWSGGGDPVDERWERSDLKHRVQRREGEDSPLSVANDRAQGIIDPCPPQTAKNRHQRDSAQTNGFLA